MKVLAGLRCSSGPFSCSVAATAVSEEADVDVPGSFSGSVCLVEGVVSTAPAPASASASTCWAAEGVAAWSLLSVAICTDCAVIQLLERAVQTIYLKNQN